MKDLEPWREFICNACGYIYNERDGDPDSGLAPGTRFKDIPDDWFCPLCGVSKADFEPYDRAAAMAARSGACATAPAHHASVTRTLGHSKSYDVVIVGGGTAAWRLVQAVRDLSLDLSVAMLDAAQANIYDKPLLSVAMSKGIDLTSLVRESGAKAAARLGVDLFAGVHAVSLSTTRQVLRTTAGEFHYRQLVLAHGARAQTIPGFDASVTWRINHLDHYVKFRQALGDSASRVLVVGAGLVGAELSNDLALGGHSVTLIDQQPKPLSRLVRDGRLSEELLAAWSSLPIRFLGETTVKSVSQQKGYQEVVLSQGITQHSLQVDHIVVAAGLRTSDHLALSAGLSWRDGYVVDPVTLQTNAPGVYAMGDCASVGGHASRFIEPIARQARTIASQLVPGANLMPYEIRVLPIRVKTTSYPMTIRPDL